MKGPQRIKKGLPFVIDYEQFVAAIGYDPDTGILTYKYGRGTHLPPRRPVTRRDSYGYIQVSFKKVPVTGSVAAWLIMTGEWPDRQIDHIDCDLSNNRWNNFRLSTQSQNCGNQRLRVTNKSGFKGVSWSKAAGKWVAVLRDKHLGCFVSPVDAHAAYAAAAKKYFGDFARMS